MKITEKDKKRFDEKCKKSKGNGCWIWTGSMRSGYGAFKINGRTLGAHRVSYEIHNGKISKSDIVVMHTCDNKKCVNPRHLKLGDQSDNVQSAYDNGLSEKFTQRVANFVNNVFGSESKDT